MTENMKLWNKVKQPPTSVLKPIMAGRLKGKTDISPQWRYQVLTEEFGPCGIGWYYEIDGTWSEEGSDGQMFAFANVKLYIKADGEWSAPICGTGGSMLVTKERAGLHSSDEGYKMAVTDALSVAMKMLGVAADIYAGKFDGSKYAVEKQEQEKLELLPPDKGGSAKIWKGAINAYIRDGGFNAIEKKAYISDETKELIKKDANEEL